jgi:hypothetical protein
VAKLTRELCDFCGGVLGRPHGTLTLPIIDPSKPAPKTEEEITRRMFSLVRMFGHPEDEARSFDICLDCGEGLVRWRHAAIEKLFADGFRKA